MAKKLSVKQMRSAKGGTGGCIYVVDGVVLNAASVQVLEGAAAAAIYGSRAANGVILITTSSAKPTAARVAGVTAYTTKK